MDPDQTPRDRALELVRVLAPDWRPTREQVLWAIRITMLVVVVLLAVLLLLFVIARVFGIRLFDLLKVMAVPITIGAAVPLLNWLQKKRELDVESRRAQDEALQAYLDQLTHLLVTKDADALLRMQVDDDVRQVIRARSVPLFQSLDSTRKWSLVLFLSVMGLLPRGQPIPIVSLAGADLRGVDGRGVPLQEVDLKGANLSKAILQQADLPSASLRNTDLTEANLMWANLSGADLSGANLSKAKLFGADLSGANLSGALLVEADLGKTSLIRANLRKADLTKTSLARANLVEADLTEAKLSKNYLRGADLSGTRGITNEELEQQAMSLKDATMPNCQKYEDWLRDKGGSEKDGANGGPS